MAKFVTAAKKFITAEEGATMVEYGMLLALITAVCVAIVGTLGTKVQTAFTNISNSFP
jgi:pilus assembly protein Flp/PilA